MILKALPLEDVITRLCSEMISLILAKPSRKKENTLKIYLERLFYIIN